MAKSIELVRINRLMEMIRWREEEGATGQHEAEAAALGWAITELLKCRNRVCCEAEQRLS